MRLLTLIITLVAFSAVATESNSVDVELQRVAAHLSSQAPTKVDGSTKLLGVTSKGKTITYHLEVYGNVLSGLDEKGFSAEVRSSILNKLCANEEATYFLENEVTQVFKYNDYQGLPISTIKILASDCYSVQSTSGRLGL